MNEQKTIVRCADIHKSFSLNEQGRSQLQVLSGIALEVYEGDFVSIVGASGSGKSTLLHILGGLDRPSVGNVWWGEKEIFSLHDDALAKLRGRHVGFVFQFHHLMPEFTALENVMIPMMILGTSKSDSRSRAEELLMKVGLNERSRHRPSELSGGEQQRVAVARALANRPRVIFADEPSGNLDSSSSENLHELLLQLNRAERQAFVIVTHNERFAEQSSRIFRMLDGKLLLL